MPSSKGSKRRGSSSRRHEECYYDVLQIERDANETAIKKAYRKLAMKWHPDKNREDPKRAAEKFKQVAEAFEVLSDPEKRRKYDRFGKEGLTGGATDFHEFGFGDAAALFEQIFGNDPFFSRTRGGHMGGGFGFFSPQAFFDDSFASPLDRGFESSFFGRMGGPSELGFGGGFGGSSMSTFSSSSFGGGGGMSKSVRTVTQTVNGRTVTKTETTIRYPDGRVETTTNESGDRLEDGHRRSRRRHLGWN